MIGPDDPVRAVTAFDVLTAESDSTVRELATFMTDHDCGILLIDQGERDPAVVSERDLIRAMALGSELDKVWASDIMTPDVLTVAADTPIAEAAAMMQAANIRHLVVEDGDSGRLGVVSIRDVLGPLLGDESLD
ncbi:MAG TPA: CBS domain-containing protein [Acidimicrobiales bacterium]|nr:CBS domain-containing protein [Acidimicrobiales bacterium]